MGFFLFGSNSVHVNQPLHISSWLEVPEKDTQAEVPDCCCTFFHSEKRECGVLEKEAGDANEVCESSPVLRA